MHQMVPASSEERLTSQAETDEQLQALWLHGRAASTQRAYCSDSRRFLRFVGKPLRSIKLVDVQAFADSISDRAPATQSRALNVVKSLFSFGHRVGYLPFNVAAAVKAPPAKDTRAERILPEAEIQRMLALERHPRNRVILRLLYGAGLRVSELCGLKQRDCQPRDEAGQITIFGKGGKTRTVLLPVSVWQDLEALPGEASDPDAPVFRSRKKGGHTFGDFVSSLSICFLSLFVGREIIRTWILECNWAGSRQVEPLVQDFHFGPGTVTGYTPAAPNTTSFRAEPCTSPPPVGARARPSAHRR